MKKIVLLLSLLTSLNACVQIKNPDQQEPTVEQQAEEKPIEVQAMQLIVDQPMYLFEDRVLTADQFAKEGRWPNTRTNIVHKYDHLVIQQDGILYTLGQNVWMEVGDLKSEGRIETFPEGSTAPEGKDGRDGGQVHLTINNAQGYLKIILRGENGGKGVNGAPPDDSLNGADGEPLTKCGDEEAGARWTGKAGRPGHQGQMGRTGGNSGSIDFKVVNDSLFTPLFERIPGRGGQGGEGHKIGGQPGVYGPVNIGCGFAYVYAGQRPKDPSLIGGLGERGLPGRGGNQGQVKVTNKNESPRYF